jgi:hypothetical protein
MREPVPFCVLNTFRIYSIVAAGLWGWSFYVLILASYTYTEDSYDTYSASALAGLGFVRNVAGAGFPLFGTQMYHKLGYEWASSLLGFLSILLIPSKCLVPCSVLCNML